MISCEIDSSSTCIVSILINRMDNAEMLKIARRVYEITAVLIDRLEMAKLWGYGFPIIPVYVFVLRQLLMYYSNHSFT